jgi:ribosomal protein L11 methyltransferase
MKFGERLWIVPGGMEIPADPRNIEIRLDPGLAFGTGTHPTTALCLEWLDGQELDSLTVVDYGCGSGILGIAAALKGAARVLCVDNDPQALQATKDNAVRNGISAVIETLGPNEYNPPSADVVVANILARPLISLAPVLLGSLREGGSLALSGILTSQAGEVLAAYRPELDGTGRQDREDWVLLHGRRKAAVPAGGSREP